jgi:hypothetical protein
MRQRYQKAAAIGFLVLVSLWVVGIIREATLRYPQPAGWHVATALTYDDLSNWNPSSNAARQVVANNFKQLGLALTPLPVVLEQPDLEKVEVHEKTAQLAMGSEAFDSDEAEIRKVIAAHQADVLNAKQTGIEPARRIFLEIRVPIDRFDALVAALRPIGQLQTDAVTDRDRTAEFRRLHAQRQSLKRYLESVLKLRGGKAGSVEDELRLEQRIQEIEKELQALSVQMGDFLGKESYYQVTVALTEYQPGSRFDPSYAMSQRVAHALVWAIGWWLAIALAALVLAGTLVSVRTLLPASTAGSRA